MDRSLQERFIRELSSHLIGDQAVFKPSLYGNGQEPADLIWLSYRCAVIIYATSGNRSLKSKRDHNNAQMHRWLRRWKQGAILRGPKIALAFDDVDHIIGISIVGGKEACCVIEDEQVKFSWTKNNYKLRISATLTDSVFHRLCQRSVGLRDIIHFFEYLRDRGDVVSDEDAIAWIEHWENICVHQACKIFAPMIADVDRLNAGWESTQALLSIIRGSRHPATLNALLSDFSFADAVWLSIAERSLASNIAKPGQTGMLVAHSSRIIGKVSFLVLVTANFCYISDEHMALIRDYDVVMISDLVAGVDFPVRMFGIETAGRGSLVCSLIQEFSDSITDV